MPDENRGMDDGNVIAVMRKVGQAARSAARILALAPAPAKNAALEAMARAILANEAAILAANALDVADALARGQIASYVDRLTLDEKRIAGIAAAIREVAAQPDPVGHVLASWTRPNGLEFERVSTPLGVVGVIFESRPNVLADAGALCLKAGNASILRGGSESFRTCAEIAKALRAGLLAAGLPEAAIQMVPTADRSAVGAMLAGLDGNLDVLVPRGGKSLVSRVQAEARVPVFAHLEGVNHTYVHAGASLDMAIQVVLNAKMRRTGVCGATETLLVDQAVAPIFLKPLVKALLEAGCEVRGDSRTLSVDPHVKPADDTDWATEYLDAIISVKVVSGLDAALAHIERYGSHHTDAIVTDDEAAAQRFLTEVDSAIVLHNASTQFADGGEFGFGGEIGIATGRMHARGPVGAEQLCSFKYRVRGHGTVRP
ncbi:glutamate-5-semialdehyde dehydrogenase [Labrys sp. La1]|uniref:glutamate-5-semialdehyde dehydrogenase n=1 Tax=Labrys sp. La1 TaxID=3404917 RepID=UPI003EBB7642